MRPFPRVSVLPLLPALLAGCSDEALPGAAAPTAWDSAGVQIVEVPAPRADEAALWRLGEDPLLHLGEGVEGDPDLQFARITGVHRLAGGRIAVVDSWTPALSFFDAEGGLAARHGRVGSGPGELPQATGGRGIRGSFTCGADTLYVVLQREIAVYSASAEHVRTFALEPSAAVRGCSGDRILGSRTHTPWRAEPGIYTDSILLVSHDLDGAEAAVLDSLPSEERAYSGTPEGGTGFSRLVFGSTLSAVAGDGVVATGFGRRFQVEMRRPDGALVRIVRVEGRGREISQSDLDRFRGFVMNPWRGNDAERERLEGHLADAPGRPLPAFAELRFDRAGNVWAREYDHLDAVAFYDYSRVSRTFEPPTLDGPRRWVVIAAEGGYLGEIALPPEFDLHEIEEDRVLGVWRDEMDVEYVRAYPLVRPGR